MKAGAALGLLAGLGAINALRGGRDGTGPRFTGLLDMLDGGGAGQSGDRFEGGGLLSMLGNLFAKPIEAQERVERIAARSFTRDRSSSPRPVLRPDLTDTIPNPFLDVAPVGTGNPLVDRIIQDRKEQVVMDQPVFPADSVSPASPNALTGGIVQPIPASSQEAGISASGLLSAPDMPVREGLPLPRDAEGILAPELPASERNTELVSFNRRMETVPEMLRGTEVEGMYRDYLLNGGLGTFAQFTNQSMATEDPSVARSPTPPALTATDVITPPTVPVTPEAAGLGMSDAEQMTAIRSAIMRDPKMISAFEEAFGVDMVREALAGLRMVGGVPNVPRAPLTRREQRGLLPTMPITRFN